MWSRRFLRQWLRELVVGNLLRAVRGRGAWRSRAMSEIYRSRATKYGVDKAGQRRLRRAVARQLPLLKFRPVRPCTLISTVYFDTANLALLERAQCHYHDNLKLRVKKYFWPRQGQAGPDVSPNCFVEIKERPTWLENTPGSRFPRKISRYTTSLDLTLPGASVPRGRCSGPTRTRGRSRMPARQMSDRHRTARARASHRHLRRGE